MFQFFDRWLSRSKKTVEPRLTEEAVIAIAREAAHEYGVGMLTVATLQENSDPLVWIVREPAIGHVLRVTVDDDSGEVIDMKRSGRR